MSMRDTSSEAAHWAMLRSEGPLDAKREAEFELWLNTSPEHQAAMRNTDLGLLSLAEAASSPELLAMRGGALERARKQARARWSTGFGGARALAIAATLLLCILGGLAAVLTPHTYSTGVGERRVVALEDGSRLSLDAATRVRVRYTNSERRLWLEQGRAKFDVAHNPLRPFSVSARGRTVVATGTSFSVELIDTEVRVLLYQGSVALLDANAPRVDSAHDSTLRPGQEFVAIDSATPPILHNVDMVRARSWEGGQLVFDDEALAVAVARVNRYAHTPIELSPNTDPDLRISGVFNANDTAAFVDGVTALLPLQRIERDGHVLLRFEDDAENLQDSAVGFDR
ncbi:MAG TPA: FecR domain-containing protein [Verrucomicrobiae bacterium]|nr:FecR domain-containing protein [Verrucomicrobiae bacterium]